MFQEQKRRVRRKFGHILRLVFSDDQVLFESRSDNGVLQHVRFIWRHRFGRSGVLVLSTARNGEQNAQRDRRTFQIQTHDYRKPNEQLMLSRVKTRLTYTTVRVNRNAI